VVNSLDELDQKLLAFIGRYRLATRPALAMFLESQAAADKRVARLVQKRLVTPVRGLPQRRVVYQLTLSGVNALGLSPARAKRPGMQGLVKHLGLMLLCNNPGQRCERVETDDISLRLGREFPEATYCLVHTKHGVALALAYVPAPQTPIRAVLRRIRKMARLLRTNLAFEGLRPLRRVGVLVVTDSPERRLAVSHAVRRPDPAGGRAPVVKYTRVWVRCVPELGHCLGLAAAPADSAPTPSDDAENTLWSRLEHGLDDCEVGPREAGRQVKPSDPAQPLALPASAAHRNKTKRDAVLSPPSRPPVPPAQREGREPRVPPDQQCDTRPQAPHNPIAR